MGNSQGKESLPSPRVHARRVSSFNPASPTTAGPGGPAHERSGSGTGGVSEPRDPVLEPRRETKAEREARKLERERVLRKQERDRSIREEGVDGGFLVTLGVYTGPEDFSKPTVRQLQIERRLAPFWKGLDDHEDTWTEHQLVAVVNGLPLPAPDEIPPEETSKSSDHLGPTWNPRNSEPNLNSLSVPMGARTMSQNSDRSPNTSPAHPTFSLPSPTSPIATNSSSPFFRGRAKTLASLASGSRNASQADMAPQELQLPKDPYVNGQRTEAFLYKNASECPICFMYYPPYLNTTRCCGQPICSECFVQIKRPDPHPPEHHGDAESPPPEPQEEIQLVSEPASCPFCVTPEFGVSYEPPPFRRGLAYNHQAHLIGSLTSAMSSTSSLNSPRGPSPGRRRATSLAVNDKTVITTDMVRPDWAKKLADARAHALRRAAAATALHNAAYMMGNLSSHESRFALGRRRRMFGSDSAGSSGYVTPRREGDRVAVRINEGSTDLFPGRDSSRRGHRLDDLEDLMMMEAIRLSLAAEEERKRKEEKEAAKEAKKEEKKKAKELKKVVKAQRNIGSGFHALDINGHDEAAGETSAAAGKGKDIDRAGGNVGFNPLSEPTSTNNTQKEDPQKHLEDRRAQIQRGPHGSPAPPDTLTTDYHVHRSALRNLSNASSSASSFAESFQNSLHEDNRNNLASGSAYAQSPNTSGLSLGQDESPPHGTPSAEPMFNFQSLAKAITADEGKGERGAQHIEDVDGAGSNEKKLEGHVDGSTTLSAPSPAEPLEDSVLTLTPAPKRHSPADDEDEIVPAPRVSLVSDDHGGLDHKHVGEVSMMDGVTRHQATQ